MIGCDHPEFQHFAAIGAVAFDLNIPSEVLVGSQRRLAASDALNLKTKELIALGISVAIRCDDCIGFHVKAALDQGATREEVIETLGMAIYMGAGPSVMYATHALEAYEQFKPASEKAADAV